MFCDLVGSTSISAKLDAEDWRDLVGGYLDAASAAVTQMGGHVAKKLGDGIMALFGYPLAQENDAERALRAALEIQRALAEINARNANSGRPKLDARIGVETGAVVVDSAGEVFGDAPNVAARVQAPAEPGAIWTTAKVQRQVAGLFVAEDRGAHALKGVPEPIDALPDRARERRRPALRAAGADAAGRPRGGAGDAAAALGARAAGRGPVRADRRRAGPRQVAADRGVPRPPRRYAAHLGRMEPPRSCCRTRRCTRSPTGAGSVSAAPTCPPNGGSPISRRRSSAIKLDPAEYVPLLAPLLDMPLPRERAANLRPRNCAAGSWRRCSRG